MKETTLTTLEAIKNEQTVPVKDLFNLVNDYDLTAVSLSKDNQTQFSLDVNKFEEYKDTFEFSQDCTMEGFNKVAVSQSDITSCCGEYRSESDMIVITAELNTAAELKLIIFHASDGLKETNTEDFHEIDVYDLKEFLDDVMKEDNSTMHCMLARVTDIFGLSMIMRNPKRTYVNTLDQGNWKLHVSDDLNTLEVPVIDDGCNLFFMRESGSSTEIVVKPFGLPFTEVGMLFFKKSDNQ